MTVVMNPVSDHIVVDISGPTATVRLERQRSAPTQINHDILSRIMEFLHIPAGQTRDPAVIFERMTLASLDLPSSLPIRSVNRLFNQLARDLLPFRLYWENLLAEPPSGIVDIAAEMEKVERSYVEDPTNPTDKHVRLFRKLMKVFKDYGVKIERGDPLKITLQDYYEFQQKVKDADLERCWPVLRHAILASLPTLGFAYSLFVPSINANADQIRSYFAEASTYPLSFVSKINLSNLRLHHIPKELLYFPNIETLDLRNNHLSDARLERLSINRDGMPMSENIPFPHLRKLQLGNHPIDGNFNRLTHLPNLSLFPSLRLVSMTNIPTMDSFAHFNLRDPVLPENSGLCLIISGCPVARYAGIENHSHGATLYNTLASLKNYEAKSPLGRLYHAVVFTDTNEATLRALVSHLSEEDKTCLYHHIWMQSQLPAEFYRMRDESNAILRGGFTFDATVIFPSIVEWGRVHCFANMNAFKRSIHLVIRRKFQVASPHLELIEHRLWIISGRLITIGGRVIAPGPFDNLKRLADALDFSLVI